MDAGRANDASTGDGGSPAYNLADRPFLATSSWNTPIPSTASLTPLSWTLSGIAYSIGWSSYSAPIYVASPADPLVQVSCPASWGWPANPSFHVPSAATGAPGTDGEIVVIDGTTVYNVWQFKRTSDSAATGSSFAATDVKTGTGWGTTSPFLAAGIMAAGSSELAGMLVDAETSAGEINHAIQVEMPAPLNLPGFSGSAISGDGHLTTGTVQEGVVTTTQAGEALERIIGMAERVDRMITQIAIAASQQAAAADQSAASLDSIHSLSHENLTEMATTAAGIESLRGTAVTLERQVDRFQVQSHPHRAAA